MILQAIVHRELLVRARQPATWRVRWVAAGLAVVVTLPPLLSQYQNPALMGQRIFIGLSVLGLAFCLFEGARQTADCLSGERREGTLGLLFLTDLKGYDVVLGKLAASSVNSFYSLLAIMPVLGLPLLAGGVTGGEFARMTVVLVNALFLALATGMWISSRSRDEMRALFTSLGMLAGMVVLPLILDWVWHWPGFRAGQARFALASPGFACYLAFAAAYPTAPGLFWGSALLAQAMSWGLLLAAAGKVHRGFQDEPERETGQTARIQTAAVARRRLDRRRRLLDENPIRWLAGRPRGILVWVWLAVATMVITAEGQRLFYALSGTRGILGWGLSGYSQVVVSFAVRFLIAWLACRFFVEARRTGTLELLLCTPLRRRDLLRGQISALWRLIFWPLLIGACAQTLFSLGPTWTYPFSWLVVLGFTVVPRIVWLLIEAMALCWFGTWSALTTKRPVSATAQTFLVVSFLPWAIQSALSQIVFSRFVYASPGALRSPFLSSYALLSPMLSVLIDLALILWAKRRLRLGFCAGEVAARPAPPPASAPARNSRKIPLTARL